MIVPDFLKGPEPIKYKAVSASQQVTQQGKSNCCSGGKFEAELTSTYGPLKSKPPVSAKIGNDPGDVARVSVLVPYSDHGFASEVDQFGTPDACTGPIPGTSFPAVPLGSTIEVKKKRRFTATWSFFGWTNTQCTDGYSPAPAAELEVSGGKQRIGDKKLVLTTGGTDIKSGVTELGTSWTHTHIWKARIVLKRV